MTTLLLVSLVCCVTAAGGRYLLQGLAGDASGRAVFVISTLVLPMLLMMSANIARLLITAWARPRKGENRRDSGL
jgi:hypothetical protein